MSGQFSTANHLVAAGDLTGLQVFGLQAGLSNHANGHQPDSQPANGGCTSQPDQLNLTRCDVTVPEIIAIKAKHLEKSTGKLAQRFSKKALYIPICILGCIGAHLGWCGHVQRLQNSFGNGVLVYFTKWASENWTQAGAYLIIKWNFSPKWSDTLVFTAFTNRKKWSERNKGWYLTDCCLPSPLSWGYIWHHCRVEDLFVLIISTWLPWEVRARLLCHSLILIFPPWGIHTYTQQWNSDYTCLTSAYSSVSGPFIQKCQTPMRYMYMSIWDGILMRARWPGLLTRSIHSSLMHEHACWPFRGSVTRLSSPAQVLSTSARTHMGGAPQLLCVAWKHKQLCLHGASMETSMSDRFEVRPVEESEA